MRQVWQKRHADARTQQVLAQTRRTGEAALIHVPNEEQIVRKQTPQNTSQNAAKQAFAIAEATHALRNTATLMPDTNYP